MSVINNNISALLLVVGLVAVLAAFWGSVGVGHLATTLAVTKTVDTNDGVCDADCSLREAIAAANSGDTINIPEGTFTIATTLGIDKDLTLAGSLSASTFIQASESPGIANYGVLSIDSGTTVAISNLTIQHGGGGGGGIANSGTLTLTNTTIRANSSWGGGGILNGGTLTLTNTTISSNTASGYGGGILVWPGRTLTLTNSSIIGNSATFGGGIANQGGTINSHNTILAGNNAAAYGSDCFLGLVSQGHNLIQDAVGCTMSGDLTGNITGQDPLLGSLDDNGGPTLTHALLSNSPAIDAGSCLTGITTDQRGVSRPQGSACDIGAFELNLPGAPTNVAATHGDSQATVSWTAPGSDGVNPITGYTVISSPGQVTATTTTTSLTVTGLTNTTAYTFTVTATNSIGTGGSSAPSSAVTPVGVPDAPINVSATFGDRLATVSWTAPASDGGRVVTGYTVISSPGGVTATTTGISVTMTGLANGTAYTFTVTATNSLGSSLSSDPSTPVTPAIVPDAPTDVSATQSDVSALVSWTAPVSDGGSPITVYTVTSDPDGVTTITASTFVAVTGLTQNTEYTFTVTATNAAGTSASSEPSLSVITKVTNIWDAPSTTSWGLAALVAGMLVVMVVALRLTSGSRSSTRP